MMLLKRLHMLNWLETVYAIQIFDNSDLVTKLTATQKLKILKRKFLIKVNMLLLIMSINFQVQYLIKD